MADIVRMRHPKVEGEATAHRSAFEGLWRGKGWVEVTATSGSKAELLSQARSRGLNVNESNTKAEIASALSEGR